ncbi:MAG: porin [Spirosomaceae bacterium]|nr:porin [Spirosomataceae bacterium]
MKKVLFLTACIGLLCGQSPVQAQGSPDYGTGMKINVNPEGSKYVRLILWNQIWARSIQNNPGTSVAGTPADKTFDIGARRLRMLAYAQISPRYMVLAHVGINNQTFLNGGGSGTSGVGGYGAGKKPQIFFHDVWNEYAVVPAIDPATKTANKRSLYIGAGLHYWWGISRMTSASTLNFLTIDAPIFNWPLIENSDQFARLFGIYAKGKLGKLDYRINVNKPFLTNTNVGAGSTIPDNIAVDNNGQSKLSTGGYFMYQFFDQESNLLPFTVGTYVGTKRVFNIGAGFYRQAEGTRSRVGSTINKHNISLASVDMFMDMPVGDKKKNMAITAYSAFYKYNFGPNYMRYIGIMNLGTNDPEFKGERAFTNAAWGNSAGDARPMIGTGNIWYTQAGILLPKTTEKPKVRVQPFGAYTLKKMEALGKAGSYWDLGANFFLDGHHSKVTFQYSTRPVYTAKDKISGNKGEFLVQFQTYL